MPRTPRRNVAWVAIEGTEPARARPASPARHITGLVEITSALLSDPLAKTIDRTLREAVELARNGIGLERVAIYLVAPDGRSMVGTWGTDMAGRTTDEHDLGYDFNALVEGFFATVAKGYPWMLYEDCPLVTHEGGRSRVVGRGWNASTVIEGGGEPLGILFNDSAISGAPVDEAKQARVAVLCALLGRALAPWRTRIFDPEGDEGRPQHPLVREVAEVLARDPSLDCAGLAKRLGVRQRFLTRKFRQHTNRSIVDYRNEVRLAQFLSEVNRKPVLAAVLSSGFGSYAQFNRAFRARFGKSPREYLFEHRPRPGLAASA